MFANEVERSHLKTSKGANIEVIRSLDIYPQSVRMKLMIHTNRSIQSSIIAK